MKKLNIAKLADALAKFQSTCESPTLNCEVEVTMSSGGKYKFKYADLAEVKRVITKPLAENGLSYVQKIEHTGLETILMHTSGEYIRSLSPLPALTAKIQDFGGATTYMKRYSLCSLLGIVAEEDDDANASAGNKTVFTPKPKPATSTDLPTKLVDGDGFPCKDCNTLMVWKEGTTKPTGEYPDGRKYQGYFCPNSDKNDKTKHKPFDFKYLDQK